MAPISFYQKLFLLFSSIVTTCQTLLSMSILYFIFVASYFPLLYDFLIYIIISWFFKTNSFSLNIRHTALLRLYRTFFFYSIFLSYLLDAISLLFSTTYLIMFLGMSSFKCMRSSSDIYFMYSLVTNKTLPHFYFWDRILLIPSLLSHMSLSSTSNSLLSPYQYWTVIKSQMKPFFFLKLELVSQL